VVSALGKKSPPVKTVIDTHFHDDHLGGNSFYAKQNVTIIGHKKILDHYESEGERFSRMKNFVTPDAYGDTTVALPTLTLEKTHTIKTQKGDIIVMNLAQKGHTDTDVVIYFPKEKILFAGDLVFNDRIFPTRDGSLSGWLAAIDALSKIDYKILIPGHGTDLSKKGYAMTKEYITSLRSQVAKAMDEGADMTNIASKVDMSQFSKYPLYKELNGKNIQRAYELLEMGEQ
jgi:glyoxylase-like metal-dependent hydrolase (beta-lactamase superfamily II)